MKRKEGKQGMNTDDYLRGEESDGEKGEVINRWEDMREERRGADERGDERSQIK